jgi:cation transport ATPase
MLTLEAIRLAVDSRYARIMSVMRDSEQHRPRLRRLGDELGAWYTPIALGLAGAAWLWSGEPVRFLAVLVVATPCPLLIGIPEHKSGLECVVLLGGAYAATFRFHDVAREDSRPFVDHLGPRHRLERILLVSGDREEEVRYLAERVGITDVHAGRSPEEKVAITRAETSRAPTLVIGDGINDAPALVAATVGLAFGHHSEITAEAAGAVIMDTSLKRVDELFHIARRMRQVALQSAVGGMAVSILGMLIAFGGLLPPVSGAVFQEIIDLGAVLNALRASVPGGELSDY